MNSDSYALALKIFSQVVQSLEKSLIPSLFCRAQCLLISNTWDLKQVNIVKNGLK